MLKSKLFNNVAYLSIIQIVNYVFPIITVPYVSRIIGPEGYGIINFATAFIGYFSILISYGFDLTATRRLAQHSGDKAYINKVISEVLTARIILFLFSCFLFFIAICFFKPIQKDITVVSIVFIGCLATVISPQFIYQGFQELQIFAKFNFVRGLLNTILIFLLIKKSTDYYWIPILNTAFLIGINFTLFFLAAKKFNINYKLINVQNALKVIFNEKMIFFSTVVISLYTTTNTVILGFFAVSKEVGYYSTSQNFLAIVSSLITVPISSALYPFIGKSFSISKQEGINKLKKILPLIFYMTFFASLVLLIFAPLIINIIYGIEFQNSILVLRIISFLPLIIGMSNVFGIQVMLNLGLDKLFFKTTFIASIIGVVLNVFMSKNYGYIGTAWNCIIVESIVTIMMFIILRKNEINIIEYSNFNPVFIFKSLKSILTSKSINK